MKTKEIRTEEELNEFYNLPGKKIIFKYSPVCGISYSAEKNFDGWIAGVDEASDINAYKVDVIYSRALSRDIAEKYNITHASPQLLYIVDNKVENFATHYDIDKSFLAGLF